MRLLLVLVLGLLTAAEPAPGWTTSAGREAQFPSATWLSAASEEHITAERDRERCLAIVSESAQAELARSVRVRVQAVQEGRTLEVSGGGRDRFEQSYASNSRLTTDLALEGRQLLTWVDEATGAVQAVCAIERQRLAATLVGRASAMLDTLAAQADLAQAHESAGRAVEAAPLWSTTLAALAEPGDDLRLAQGVQSDPATAAQLERHAAQHARAAAAAARLAGRVVQSADDLAYVLASQLLRAAPADRPLVQVPVFTVRDTRLASAFGRWLAQAVGGQLASGGWPVSRAVSAGLVKDATAAAGTEAVCLGSVWELANEVRVVLSVIRLRDGRVVAAAAGVVPKAVIATTGLDLAPQNAASALADQLQLSRDEILDGGMRVDVWTSKGDDAPVFAAGEVVRVYVRVDRPCHLRLIDHLADGRRVLLVDDLFLDQEKVNQVYELPDLFEVAAPFGAEVLQANASTRPFARLATRQEDGYAIISEALTEVIAKTRGLKRVETELRQAEARVTVTTLAR